MSPLAENNRGACALRQSVKKKIQLTIILKNLKVTKCFVVSSHVPTLKHEVKQGYKTQKHLFQLLHKTNSRFWVNSRCLTLCFSVGS